MMLNDDELKELFFSPESDRVERKQSISDDRQIKQYICAFSNDLQNHKKEGVIFIGQKDDLSCANLPIDDNLIQSLRNFASDDNLQPRPSVQIKELTINNCKVVAIIVSPHSNTPVRYKQIPYIVIGSSIDVATEDQQRILREKRKWGNLPFDMQEVPLASVDDLDILRLEHEFIPAYFTRETIEQNGRTFSQKLQAARVFNLNEKPTVAGLLFTGKDPLQFLLGAYVSWRRVEGVIHTNNTIDEKTISGTIFEQVRRIEELFENNNTESLILGETIHTRQALYPKVAFQQLIRNALFHRNYEGTNSPVRVTLFDDRVEILNPGGLYGSVNKENLGIMTDYRNPTIVEFAKSYKLVEKSGIGIQLARAVCREEGIIEPKFEVHDSFFKATLYNRNSL